MSKNLFTLVCAGLTGVLFSFIWVVSASAHSAPYSLNTTQLSVEATNYNNPGDYYSAWNAINGDYAGLPWWNAQW